MLKPNDLSSRVETLQVSLTLQKRMGHPFQGFPKALIMSHPEFFSGRIGPFCL
jgi:hypothetical protein